MKTKSDLPKGKRGLMASVCCLFTLILCAHEALSQTVQISATPALAIAPARIDFTVTAAGLADPCEYHFTITDAFEQTVYDVTLGSGTDYKTLDYPGTYTIAVSVLDCSTNMNYPDSTTVTLVSPALTMGTPNRAYWGQQVTIPLTLSRPSQPPGLQISAIAADISFDPDLFTVEDVTAGPNAVAAGKDILFENAPTSPGPCGWYSSGVVRIMIASSVNNNPIGDGVVANLILQPITPDPYPNKDTDLSACPSASTPSAQPVYIEESSTPIYLTHLWGDCPTASGNPPDLVVDIGEVQSAIAMFLGRTQMAYCVDRNQGGTLSIDELQLIIDHYLGIFPALEVPVRRMAVLGNPSVTLGMGKGRSGETVTLPLVLVASGRRVAALSADIEFDPDLLESPTAAIGPAGKAADKDVLFETVEPGRFRVGVIGINKDAMTSGTAATVTFKIKRNAPAGKAALKATCRASSAKGDTVTLKKPDQTSRILVLKKRGR